jgi:hypothetical protein
MGGILKDKRFRQFLPKTPLHKFNDYRTKTAQELRPQRQPPLQPDNPRRVLAAHRYTP